MDNTLKNELNGKVVIVTGSAEGLGKEIAVEFGKKGATVALFDNKECVDTIGILESNKSSFVSYVGDITDEKCVNEFIRVISAKYGEVDILINNAGVHFSGCLELTSPEDLDRVLRTNVIGTFIMTKAAIKHMRKCSSSRIINISSSAAFDNISGTIAYSCSKAAINSLTQTIAKELIKYGITVNSICPTVIATDALYKKAREQSNQLNVSLDALIKNYSKEINIQQRLLGVNEVLESILYLCSRLSEGITGTSLLINCGSYMR